MGTPRRSGHVRTKKKMNSIEKKEEEDTELEYETPSDINNYVSGLKRRKVLFSKYKLKHAMKVGNAISSISNLSKQGSKDFLDSDSNNSMSLNQIKKGMMKLRKLAYRLKKKKKEVQIIDLHPKSPRNKPQKIRKMINPKKLKSSMNFTFLNNQSEVVVDNPMKHSQIIESSSKKEKLSHKLLFDNNIGNNNPLYNSMISNDIKTERIVHINEISFNDDSSVSD